MAVSDDRKYTGQQVYNLLEGVKCKTLGEVDKSHQFARTATKPKITGIAGDVVEQSVFGYNRDSKQECDIEIDGVLTELKTTGVRIPKDVSLMGFDNISFSALPQIDLTTVNQPFQQMAIAAVDMLLERIKNPAAAHAKLILPPSLIERKSCRALGK